MAEGRLRDADTLIRQLRLEFGVLARERLREMDVLLSRLRAGRDDSALRDLRRNAHGLAGSGGSVGLPEVTRIARQLEGECRQRLESGEAPGGIELTAWAAALDALRSLLADG